MVVIWNTESKTTRRTNQSILGVYMNYKKIKPYNPSDRLTCISERDLYRLTKDAELGAKVNSLKGSRRQIVIDILEEWNV